MAVPLAAIAAAGGRAGAAALPSVAARGGAVAARGAGTAARIGRVANVAGRVARKLVGRTKAGPLADTVEQLATQKITSPQQAADATLQAIDALKEAAEGLSKYLPHFGHAITVNVRGGPAADLRRVWYLALAACFGRYKRGLSGIWGRSINAQWNITGKEVSVTLAYTFTGILENAGGAAIDETGLTLLQRGPDQVTIGDGFPTWMRTSRQVAAAGFSGWSLLTGQGSTLYAIVGGGLRSVISSSLLTQDTKQTGALSKFMQAGAGTLVANPKPVDPRTLIQGWRVDNDTLLGTDVPNRVFQPFRNRPVPNIFRELPLKVGIGGVSLVERLPYRRVMPGLAETTAYVNRGGLFGFVPTLPDDGRVITTGEKRDPRVQPPKPPVDGVSRSNAIAMITAVLADPGFLVAAPEDTENSLGSEGVYAYAPGTGGNGYATFGYDTILGRPDPALITDVLNGLIEGSLDRNEVPKDSYNVQ